MTLYKKSVCESRPIISSSVYACSSCDYAEVIECNDDKDIEDDKKCPKCEANLKIVSSHTGVDGDDISAE